MDLHAEYARLAENVRIVPKSGVWHQRAIHHLLRVVTLGAQSSYLDRYVTTMWHTVYVPDDWEARAIEERYATLRHELVHVRQFERWGLVMAVAYLLLPLPLGLLSFLAAEIYYRRRGTSANPPPAGFASAPLQR